jgi:hypothetical protein
MIQAGLGSVAMCNRAREPAMARWQSRVRIRGLRFTRGLASSAPSAAPAPPQQPFRPSPQAERPCGRQKITENTMLPKTQSMQIQPRLKGNEEDGMREEERERARVWRDCME